MGFSEADQAKKLGALPAKSPSPSVKTHDLATLSAADVPNDLSFLGGLRRWVKLAGNGRLRIEREFADPDAIDPARKVNRHLAFGMGSHQCVDRGADKVGYFIKDAVRQAGGVPLTDRTWKKKPCRWNGWSMVVSLMTCHVSTAMTVDWMSGTLGCCWPLMVTRTSRLEKFSRRFRRSARSCRLDGNWPVSQAGPAIMMSYFAAGLACAFAALCYAEFASMIPIAGSAYTYGYATLGELLAWIIGWDLILEYAVGNIAVAISWAAYFRQLLLGFGIEFPAFLATDYRSTLLAAKAAAKPKAASAWPRPTPPTPSSCKN